jgi:hypothetical protein
MGYVPLCRRRAVIHLRERITHVSRFRSLYDDLRPGAWYVDLETEELLQFVGYAPGPTDCDPDPAVLAPAAALLVDPTLRALRPGDGVVGVFSLGGGHWIATASDYQAGQMFTLLGEEPPPDELA